MKAMKAIAATTTIVVLVGIFFWKILFTNLILTGVDIFLYFYPYKAYAAEALRQGRLPLWNPHLFMGVPFLANSQVGLFYPPNWLFIGLMAPKQIAWSIALHLMLGGVFMLMYTRLSLKLSWVGATIAAIVFALGGYLGAQVEHINQLNGAVWLPLLLLLYDFALDKTWRWTLGLALVVGLILLAGHTQTVFISMVGLGLYALARTAEPMLETWRIQPLLLLRTLAPLAVASVVGIGIAAIQLLPTAELSSLSIRSQGLTLNEAVSFSLRPQTLHYTLLPPFNVELRAVWGEAFSEWVAYIGLSGLLLAILGGLSLRWNRGAGRYVFVAASGLFLSFGLYTGPVYLVLYYVAPGFDLFRVPARWLLLYAFGAAILAGYGFEAWHRRAEMWAWLTAQRWRLGVSAGLPFVALLGLIAWETPPLVTLAAWLGFGIVIAALLVWNHPAARYVVAGLLIVELFWAAQTLNYNHPTAPQAYTSIRNGLAYLKAAESNNPPGRFFSLSGINYDPGDLADIQQVYGDALSQRGVYALVLALKQKEVLAFNLPMLYDIHSVDGYDGGILPLLQFLALQQLFLPPDDLSRDGRLRETLRVVPEGRLLSLLNTRWIMTDKVFDQWIDGIFYDLQFPARLTATEAISTTDIPDFPATAIGLVSHLEGGASIAQGTQVATLGITWADGSTTAQALHAGEDTAEGQYSAEAAHAQPQIGAPWPYEAGGVDYITVLTLPTTQPIRALSLTADLDTGRFVLRGLSLIHQPSQTSRSILMSTEGDYQLVHSGDIKLYENRAALPRAYVVHQMQIVSDTAAVVEAIRAPTFDPATRLIRTPHDATESPGLLERGQPSPNNSVTITHYQPERIDIEIRLESAGWLVLSDAYYPGWIATVNGQPVDITRVNIMFRAVTVPAGESTVSFIYRPPSLQLGAWITGITLLLCALGFVVTRRWPRQ